MILNKILKEIDDIKSISYDKWLTIKQTVGYTGLSDSTIRRAVRKGILKAGNKGGKLVFKRSNIDKWLKGY
tara:strand:- start:365 stop:577 length:213 start_codon:yes stop_codon:yes gene_type:complete